MKRTELPGQMGQRRAQDATRVQPTQRFKRRSEATVWSVDAVISGTMILDL